MNVVAIKGYRKEIGLTQQSLADMVGVCRETVNEWELGKRMPGLGEADKLAEILRCTVYDLWPSMGSARNESLKIREAQSEAVNRAIDRLISMASPFQQRSE